MTADDLDGQQPEAIAFSHERQVPQPVTSWSYRNCREARAAGAAPLYRGQPGYGPHMDGDSDGIACEPYSR
ncbi:excalibur calcium-binding domain-containing protein [Sphingobium abikonense]|uniref:excalibur calcium-binding domain-containing protein n=1 Tax=Sphingobium abikonense TaxID=86193 RepID=UPI0035114877